MRKNIKKKAIFSWVAQVTVAIILAQTLFFKFTDAPETVELFSQLGLGAVGYKTIGFLELVASVLLLIPSSALWGGILSWGLMSGAILAHLTKIGFDGPNLTLGMLAIVAWLLSVVVIYVRKEQAGFIVRLLGLRKDARHD
jgi:uncharacterized membrane protein YphA (DoxX/SURF4 family)